VDADNSAAKSTQECSRGKQCDIICKFQQFIISREWLTINYKKEDKEERKKKRTRSIVSLSQLAGEDIALSSWD